ncbi:MAG TPA: DMT family transporter [Acidimicrobiales bacterium]|nr:DMT family transporter [Acidimicrobiales bacterium]
MSHHAPLAAGVSVSVVSAVLYNVGFVVEKRALGALPEVHARRVGHLVRSLCSSPLWLTGFLLLLAGLGLQVLALSLISISVVQPIFVSGIVILLVLSHVSLGERLRRNEWVVVSLIGLSLLAISLSLDAGSDRAGSHGDFALLAAAAVPTVAFALWLFFSADRAQAGVGWLGHIRTPLYGVAAGLLYGVAALAAKAVSAQIERDGLVHAIPHIVGSPFVYALGVTSAAGLLLFQTALQRCPASVIVPMSNVISSTYVVIVGSAIFGEHLPTAGWKVALRLSGFVGVLASVALWAGARAGDEAGAPLPGPRAVIEGRGAE